MNATERGDLAERLLPIAAGLACIVHGDGDRRDVGHILAQFDQAERDALIVVLAGLVNPDTTLGHALGYITWDKEGRKALLDAGDATLRSIAIYRNAPAGVHAALLAEKRMTARIMHRHHGVPMGEVADGLGVNTRTVFRWVHAERVA